MVDNFQYQHSHLFQLVYEANKEGIIDQFEKLKIKEMIISENPDLNPFYEEYNKTQDSTKFIQNLKAFCNGTLTVNTDEQAEILKNILSSPEDSRLVKRKKAKGKKTTNPPEMFGDTVQMCEDGMSPKTTFVKRKYDQYEDSDS